MDQLTMAMPEESPKLRNQNAGKLLSCQAQLVETRIPEQRPPPTSSVLSWGWYTLW